MKNKKKYTSAILCEHANEVPGECKCPDNCYCKNHTCKNRVKSVEKSKEVKESAYRIANRQSTNLLILKHLEDFFKKNPEIRFFQGLQILGLQESNIVDDFTGSSDSYIPDNFHEESEETVKKLISRDEQERAK